MHNACQNSINYIRFNKQINKKKPGRINSFSIVIFKQHERVTRDIVYNKKVYKNVIQLVLNNKEKCKYYRNNKISTTMSTIYKSMFIVVQYIYSITYL